MYKFACHRCVQIKEKLIVEYEDLCFSIAEGNSLELQKVFRMFCRVPVEGYCPWGTEGAVRFS